MRSSHKRKLVDPLSSVMALPAAPGVCRGVNQYDGVEIALDRKWNPFLGTEQMWNQGFSLQLGVYSTYWTMGQNALSRHFVELKIAVPEVLVQLMLEYGVGTETEIIVCELQQHLGVTRQKFRLERTMNRGVVIDDGILLVLLYSVLYPRENDRWRRFTGDDQWRRFETDQGEAPVQLTRRREKMQTKVAQFALCPLEVQGPETGFIRDSYPHPWMRHRGCSSLGQLLHRYSQLHQFTYYWPSGTYALQLYDHYLEHYATGLPGKCAKCGQFRGMLLLYTRTNVKEVVKDPPAYYSAFQVDPETNVATLTETPFLTRVRADMNDNYCSSAPYPDCS
jgi:hypothetical protein